jgi:hypothetical protein
MPLPDEADAITMHIACGSLEEDCLAEGASQIRALVNAKLDKAVAEILPESRSRDDAACIRRWAAGIVRSLKMGDE